MITKIYFPVANTASLSSATDIVMTTDDYENAIIDNVYRNKTMMDDFTKHGFSVRNNNYYGVDYKDNNKRDVNDYIEYYELEALVTMHTGVDIDINHFDTLVETKKMSILSLNINPNDMDYDVESEINMWMGDSDRVNSDNTIDNQKKILSLEGKNIKIDVNDKKYFLENCKIIKNNSDRNNPLNIFIIVEKINKL